MEQLTVYGVDSSGVVLDNNLTLAGSRKRSFLDLQWVGLGLCDVCSFVRHDV
jgi:hypothetical protein